MADQNNQSSIDRQYLKAMGIDIWVDKNTSNSVSAQESHPAAQELSAVKSAPVSSLGASAGKALSALSATEFSASINKLMLTCANPLKEADVLVIIEGPGLTAEASGLLETMLKAIKLDDNQWFQAELSQSSDASPITVIEKSVNPKAMIFMLKAGGSTTALNRLRGTQHWSDALQAFSIVSFHPQDLLDNLDTKRPAWEDLKQLRQWLS